MPEKIVVKALSRFCVKTKTGIAIRILDLPNYKRTINNLKKVLTPRWHLSILNPLFTALTCPIGERRSHIARRWVIKPKCWSIWDTMRKARTLNRSWYRH